MSALFQPCMQNKIYTGTNLLSAEITQTITRLIQDTCHKVSPLLAIIILLAIACLLVSSVETNRHTASRP